MNEEIQKSIEFLEAEWSKPEGFLGRARDGQFDSLHGNAFVDRTGSELTNGIFLALAQWRPRRFFRFARSATLRASMRCETGQTH